MGKGVNIDGVLVTWGDRLFYPGNRPKGNATLKLRGDALHCRAAAIRNRIESAVVRRPPQVMVKVTGGGRSTRAISAHFRYISKNGRLEIEDDRGESIQGKQAVRDLTEDWRFSGSLIVDDTDVGSRREAFNIMLSMPRGTDPLAVQRAARQFARVELESHKYVMVLHDHQSNPHVHISVRAEDRNGRRLNPRKADLARWRETFAEKLREQGIEAEASRQGAWGTRHRSEALWRIKALDEGRLRNPRALAAEAPRGTGSMAEAVLAWERIATALAQSPDAKDRGLARAVGNFVASVYPEREGEKGTSRPSRAPLVR